MATQRECVSLRIEDPNMLKKNGIIIPAILHMGSTLKVCKSYDAVLYTDSISYNIKIFPKKTFTLRLGTMIDLIIVFKDIIDENSNPQIKEGMFVLIDDDNVRKNIGDIAFYVNWVNPN
jgi:hypothetical protein